MTRSVAKGGKGKGMGIETSRMAMEEASKSTPADSRQKEFYMDLKQAADRAKRGEFKTAKRCKCRHDARWIGNDFLHLHRGVSSKECRNCKCTEPKPLR